LFTSGDGDQITQAVLIKIAIADRATRAAKVVCIWASHSQTGHCEGVPTKIALLGVCAHARVSPTLGLGGWYLCAKGCAIADAFAEFSNQAR
jgi:hypothetical protein